MPVLQWHFLPKLQVWKKAVEQSQINCFDSFHWHCLHIYIYSATAVSDCPHHLSKHHQGNLSIRIISKHPGHKHACVALFVVHNHPQFRHKTHNFMQCVQVTSILPLMSHLFLWWPTTKRPGHWRKDVRLFLFFTCQVTKEQVMSAENLWNMFSLIIQDYGLILGELGNWVSS